MPCRERVQTLMMRPVNVSAVVGVCLLFASACSSSGSDSVLASATSTTPDDDEPQIRVNDSNGIVRSWRRLDERPDNHELVIVDGDRLVISVPACEDAALHLDLFSIIDQREDGTEVTQHVVFAVVPDREDHWCELEGRITVEFSLRMELTDSVVLWCGDPDCGRPVTPTAAGSPYP